MHRLSSAEVRTGARALCKSGAAAACLLGLWAGAASAQQPAPAVDPFALEPEQLFDATVIHVRRRDEALFDTPVAATAIGATELNERGIARIEELNQLIPNVQVRQSSSTGGAVEINIRGQQVAISNPANDPPVGLYYDDVYVAQSKGAAGAIFDLQDVEVSRGVQGLFSGRNNTGGALRVYTHRPELGVFDSSLSASVGIDNLTRFQTILNVPAGEALAVRIGYSNYQRDGFGRSLITGQPFQGVDQQFWRVSALWQPAESLNNLFTYEGTRIDQPQMNIRAVPGTLVACAVAAGTQSCTPSTANVNQFLAHYPLTTIVPDSIHDNSWDFITQGDHIEVNFFRDTATWNVSNDLTAKLILGYRDMRALSGLDVDVSPGFVAQARDFGATSHQSTIEPQLSGAALDGRLDWVAGYFHFEDHTSQLSTSQAPLGGAPPATLTITIRDKLINSSDAVYAHGEYHVTDAWRIAAGVRYTDDEREYHPNRLNGSNCGLRSTGNVLVVASGPCPNVALDADFNYVSYEASTTYQFSDNVTGYFRTGRGQKSGGFTSPLVRIDTPAFRPEQVTDYELGLHARGLFDGALGLNAAVFFTDYKDMQRYTSQAAPGIGISSQTLNAGAATIMGAELDGTWRVNRDLTISGFVGYIDANYDSFVVLDASLVSHDLSNMDWYQTPKLNTRLGFSYEAPISFGQLRIGAGWYHQSETSLYVLTFSQLKQRPYDLFDGHVTWTSPDQTFDVSLWGTNLTDEEYATGATASPVSPFDTSLGLTSAGLVAGDARVLGLTLTYHLGRWRP